MGVSASDNYQSFVRGFRDVPRQTKWKQGLVIDVAEIKTTVRVSNITPIVMTAPHTLVIVSDNALRWYATSDEVAAPVPGRGMYEVMLTMDSKSDRIGGGRDETAIKNIRKPISADGDAPRLPGTRNDNIASDINAAEDLIESLTEIPAEDLTTDPLAIE